MFKRVIVIFLMFFLCSCSSIRFSISLTATGEYKERAENYQENLEYHKKYGINYYPFDNIVYFGDRVKIGKTTDK